MYCSLQYNGGKDMTSGSFTSTADMDFFIDVDASGTELVIVSDNITTRHQVCFCYDVAVASMHPACLVAAAACDVLPVLLCCCAAVLLCTS